MTRVEPVGAFGDGVIVTDTCDRCIRPATTERVTWNTPDGSSELLVLCDDCAEQFDDNCEPGDSFYEGRG